MTNIQKSFADYKADGHLWITLSTGEYYPDILPLACELYKPVLVTFGHILESAHSSIDLFTSIAAIRQQWMRIQLSRVFRKYVSPETPVEMLKNKSKVKQICDQFGNGFREITEVQRRFKTRPLPDEALCALLWEYKDRGKKGYDLTERLFTIFREEYPTMVVTGPERAGKDILLGAVFKGYTKPDRPVDFVIYDQGQPIAVGLARYDSDRGGAQEDDRTGQYRECANEVLTYARKFNLNLKVVFLNDGPGLLLGSMWNDYAYLENLDPNIRVVTLRMVKERLPIAWLRG